MAVYQYYLGVIPQQGFDYSIPDKIGINTETGYFETDAEMYWGKVNLNADNIISKVDLIIKRANWGNDKTNFTWKNETDEVDNDAYIHLDEKTLTIREFSFRADLREQDLMFLKKMIELGKENNWLFFDRKGKILKPDFEKIKISIRNSNAYSFLKDPVKFLENIANKYK